MFAQTQKAAPPGRAGVAGFDRNPAARVPAFVHLQRTMGNQGVQRSLTTDESSGTKRLSDAGRRYFGPLVGAAVDHARVHVDGRADRLAHLAGARALTFGNHVFIPPAQFSPASAAGRALLGHELAHVAQRPPGPPRLHRQPQTEPHYPTVDEQAEIEKVLARDFREAEAAAPAPAVVPGQPPPAVQRGRALNQQERDALAARLQAPLFEELDKLGTASSGGGDKLEEAEAFKVVEKAHQAIQDKFGPYLVRNISLTRNEQLTVDARRAANQVLVIFRASPEAAVSLARTLVETHCAQCKAEMTGLDDASRRAVIGALVRAMSTQRADQLRRAAQARVGGAYSADEDRVAIPLKAEAELYGTAVHELIHSLAHPAFHAAFLDERNIVEGFTEYFTREVVSRDTAYQEAYEKIRGVRQAMKGPFLIGNTGGSPEESMRQAYFRGRLELIGWKPSGPEEQKAVEDAGGSAQWDPALARRYGAVYQERAVAAQAPSRNVLGVGLFFTPQSADRKTVSVRYARVLARSEPYAKSQLLLEGQLWGSPTLQPKALGASLGVAAEYQEPYFYLGGGVRFVGTTGLGSGTDRLDVSPFAGFGVRAWQTIRVGAEGFALVPIKGEGTGFGAGITLGVEL